MRSLYFKIFSASFLITFLSPEIATSIKMDVPLLLSQIMSGLLLGCYCCRYHHHHRPCYHFYAGYFQLCT